jgi:hypothetical protein
MVTKRHLSTLFCIFVVMLFTTACQPEEEVAVLPTLAQLPTLTPTDTPTDTATPTSTDTDTPTPTPTATNTATATNTLTPSITPTNTLTPTFTFTPTATETETPTLTITPNLPQIISFAASGDNIPAGQTVTVRWNSNSDVTKIQQLNQQGQLVQTFDVPPSGELNLAVPNDGSRQVIFRLVAQRGGQEVATSIPILIQCSISWFFGNQFAPPESSCPRANGAKDDGAFQPFERGVMIYLEADNLDKVYGLQNDGNRYISYRSEWDGTTEEDGDPPDDLDNPEEHFNWAFFKTNAPVGRWEDTIGWATDDLDDDDRTIQYEITGAFYIDAPGGVVYRFSGGESGTWTRIK